MAKRGVAKRRRAEAASAEENGAEAEAAAPEQEAPAPEPRSKPKKAKAKRESSDGAGPSDDLPHALPQPAAAALVFVAAGAVLMLEILAVRLLAPYVGLTLETTTSIIGAALAGIAGGAAVGGYFADRVNTRRLIVGLLIGGGLLTLLTVPVVRWLGPGARGNGDLAALGITLIALVPAAATLSAVSPAVAHLQLHNLHSSGTIVGRLSAWGTAGALLGTFGTGFVLVPLMPVSTSVLLIGAVLLLAGIALAASTDILTPARVAAVAAVAVGFGSLSVATSSPCDVETNYHCVSVESIPRFDGYNLVLDGDSNSFVVPDDPRSLIYEYTRWIADGIDPMYPGKDPINAVFVGGGGLTLPRWLLSTRPGSKAHVLEVDGEMVHFVEDRFNLQEPGLKITVGDARMEMRDVPTNSADVVVGDAFSGLTVPWHLTTEEWLDEVKRVLKPDGLYAMNMIDYKPDSLLKAEVATLLDSFANVRLLSIPDSEGEPGGEGNTVVLASDRAIPKSVSSIGTTTYQQPAVESFAANAEPLRDDYAPVDQLLTIEE